jgi:hypothetical protein
MDSSGSDPVLEFEHRKQEIRRAWYPTMALLVLPGFALFLIFAVGGIQPAIGLIGFAVLGIGVLRGLYLQHVHSRCPVCEARIRTAWYPFGLDCPTCGVELIRRR